MWAELFATPIGDFISKTGAGLAVAAVVGYVQLRDKVNRLGSQHEALVLLIEQKRVSIAEMTSHQSDHAERIAVIESVMKDLKELSPALRGILTVTATMETLLTHTVRRLDLLEDRFFSQNH